ncbi:Arrestin domain-containing protein 5 [Eumeta japonica]|uniref:Arrestin domain-containing protein 5 n=1 Tax=Eumeta variegata TaxID=151549 RepID=A0A4C1ULI9_EUMVA|nr:Arrestin domain-containing protein 5 [Eumeta japonica]
MRISCEIHLQKPPDSLYEPGGVVSGAVKYTIYEDAYFEDIVACLRGKGRCRWTEGRDSSRRTYHGHEDYLRLRSSLLYKKDSDEEVPVGAGAYTHRFQFVLPSDIPSSYKDYFCTICYYVKIKFVRKGLLNFNKSFRTEIPFKNSSVTSDLPSDCITYGAEKSLMSFWSFFNADKNLIRLKAVIEKSILIPGDKARLQIEVQNDSTTGITAIETQLIKKVTHISNSGKRHRRHHPVEYAKSVTAGVKEKCCENFTNTILIPDTDYTIQHSKILKLDYVLMIKAKLPFPHLNLSLEIPVVIGEVEQRGAAGARRERPAEPASAPDEPPPSYWEAMREDKIIEGKK